MLVQDASTSHRECWTTFDVTGAWKKLPKGCTVNGEIGQHN